MHRAPRTAGPSDAAAIAELDQSVNPDPWGRARLRRACAGGGALRESVLVIEEAGQLCGYIVVSRVLDEASIHMIGVCAQQRRAGLGGALVDTALSRLREEGLRRCLLEVRASNKAARALYASRGFGMDGVRRNYYPGDAGREDAVLMSLEL